MPRRAVVYIIGATGTGKSELAVSLARRFNGEIINGDALQLYEGLPITTNKIAESDRHGIPHHLIGCISLHEQPWTVHRYFERANLLLNEISLRGKLPIVVGGTHYYLQSLLSPNTLVEGEPPGAGCSPPSTSERTVPDATADETFQKLRQVDPAMAARLHPKDTRKIQRALEIYFQKGKPASQVYAEQKQDLNRLRSAPEGMVSTSLAMDKLVFWTHAPLSRLNPRLNERVNRMVAEGLLDEVQVIRDFGRARRSQGFAMDESHGIWTAIGYKEFLPLINDPNRPEKVEAECTERTKIATRQYAKRQIRWIRLKIMPALVEANQSRSLFLLNTSELSDWFQNVETIAANITDLFLHGGSLPDPRSLSQLAAELLSLAAKPTVEARHCAVCDKTLMTEDQWKGHVRSKGHQIAIRPKIDWKNICQKAD